MAKKKTTVQQRAFNLLKPVEQPKTAWDKVYDWLIGKARIVVFFVEILIIIAFVCKFIVDTQAKSKDKKFAVLRTQESFYTAEKEPQFRAIQLKSNNYVKLWNGSSSLYAILEEVYSYLPGEDTNLTVTINSGQVVIDGYVNLDELQTVEDNFKASKSFSDVYVKQLALESQDIQTNTGKYELIGVIGSEYLTRTDL